MKTLSIQDFAAQQGHQDRVTLEASLPYHVAYTRADTTQQKDLKARYLTGYVCGYLNVDEGKAGSLLEMTREERNAKNKSWEKAVNGAAIQFRRHIVRIAPVKASNHVVVPRAAKAAAVALIELCGGYAAALAALKAAK